jgi:hypothetical protein
VHQEVVIVRRQVDRELQLGHERVRLVRSAEVGPAALLEDLLHEQLDVQ